MPPKPKPTTNPTGLAKDSDWQVGVQRTLPLDLEEAWSLLVSDVGTRIWLGTRTPPDPAPGARYKTPDGTVGEIRSFRVCDRVRLTWRPKAWDHDSTIEATLIPSPAGTTLRFHQERLASQEEREAMRAHWQHVLDALARHLEAQP